ncbi:MAG: hypothetical protein FWH28_08915, partial [Clostridiales bacterium]|nr:hypothetical protein [Clostridiales bacterium]
YLVYSPAFLQVTSFTRAFVTLDASAFQRTAAHKYHRIVAQLPKPDWLQVIAPLYYNCTKADEAGKLRLPRSESLRYPGKHPRSCRSVPMLHAAIYMKPPETALLWMIASAAGYTGMLLITIMLYSEIF